MSIGEKPVFPAVGAHGKLKINAERAAFIVPEGTEGVVTVSEETD